MALNDIVQVLQHTSFVSAVLAGFAVTLLIGLLPIAPKRRLVSFAAGAALVAAALLSIATVASISGVISAILDPESASGPTSDSTVYGAYIWASLSFLLGILFFVISIGLSGWVRSKKFGVASATTAAVTILGLAYFLLFIVRGL